MTVEMKGASAVVTFAYEDFNSKFTKKARQYIRELNEYCINKKLNQFTIPAASPEILDKLYHHQNLVNQSVISRAKELQARREKEKTTKQH